MDFNDVIMMRETGGPFAGGMFLIAFLIIKSYPILIGIVIGILVERKEKKLSQKKGMKK